MGENTTGGQQKSKCVAKLEKTPLFGVKVRIKKKRPGTDFVSIPGSFMKIDHAYNTFASRLLPGCNFYT